jgi:Predicted AAA-ATPase
LEDKQVLRQLADLLKSEFFAVIKEFCGKSVKKYWLTGVIPAFRDASSPLTATEVISFRLQYQSLCGFTQEDVNAMVTRALPESERASALDSLKRWYSGYMFTPHDSENSILYNPQQVFLYLRKCISGWAPLSCTDEANTVKTRKALSIVGEIGPVTTYDLASMLFTKASANILSELSFVELMQEHEMLSWDMAWSLLYYRGIVTFCGESDYQKEGAHSLCVPNDGVDYAVSPWNVVLERVLIINSVLADSPTHHRFFQW